METNSDINIEEIISNILSKEKILSKKISGQEIMGLCSKSIEIFKNQPMLLELSAPIKICGDSESHFLILNFFKAT